MGDQVGLFDVGVVFFIEGGELLMCSGGWREGNGNNTIEAPPLANPLQSESQVSKFCHTKKPLD